MEVANNRVPGFNDHVRFWVGIDGKDVFGGHSAHPVLNCPRNPTGDVEVGGDSSAGLANLVTVGSPPIVRYSPGTAHHATQSVGELFESCKSFSGTDTASSTNHHWSGSKRDAASANYAFFDDAASVDGIKIRVEGDDRTGADHFRRLGVDGVMGKGEKAYVGLKRDIL